MNFDAGNINIILNVATILFIGGAFWATVRVSLSAMKESMKKQEDELTVYKVRVTSLEVGTGRDLGRIEQKIDDIRAALNIKHV